MVVRVCFTEEVTCKERKKGISGERAVHAEEVARSKSIRWAHAWHVAGVSRKPVFVLPERRMG